jgi:hypothetical protein
MRARLGIFRLRFGFRNESQSSAQDDTMPTIRKAPFDYVQGSLPGGSQRTREDASRLHYTGEWCPCTIISSAMRRASGNVAAALRSISDGRSR